MELAQIPDPEWCRCIPAAAVVLGKYCAIERILDDHLHHRCRLDAPHDGPHVCWCTRPYSLVAEPLAMPG